MKKGVMRILSSILVLAVFSIWMLGCDWVSCDQEGTYTSSSDACWDYCTDDLGCSKSTWNNITGYCTCE